MGNVADKILAHFIQAAELTGHPVKAVHERGSLRRHDAQAIRQNLRLKTPLFLFSLAISYYVFMTSM